MYKINIVYSLSGGVGVSYVASFLACYGNSLGMDLNYQHPSLIRYDNVTCVSEEDMVFLNKNEYMMFCKGSLEKVLKGFKNEKSSSYVLDIGNLLVLEFETIFRSITFLNFLKKSRVEIIFHCVISGNDPSFDKKSILSFRETLKNYKNSSLVVWENNFFKKNKSEDIKLWAEDILGRDKVTYKVIEAESGLLYKELREKMNYKIPISSEKLKEEFDSFTYMRLKKYYRKWEELIGKKEFLF